MTDSSRPASRPLSLRQFSELFDRLSAQGSDADLTFIELDEGEILIRQGEIGDYLYVLLSGSLDVRLENPDGTTTLIDRLVPGAVVGEMALLSGGRRAATVAATARCQLARLGRSALDDLSDAGSDELAELAAPRWQRVRLTTALNELFGALDGATITALHEQTEWQHLDAGALLFNQGDVSDGMYVVISGRLLVSVAEAGAAARIVNEIGPGETVGEFSLVTDELRSATVRAARDSIVARISAAAFQRLAGEHPDLMRRMAAHIVDRLHRELGYRRPPPTSTCVVALLPASPDVDVWQFAQELAGALACYGTSGALDSAHFEAERNNPGAAQVAADDPSYPAIAAWMDEFEAGRQYVLYVADPDPSQWTRRCLGRADRVLLVTDPRSEPAPAPAAALLDQNLIAPHVERLFWHPPATGRPAGSSRWLAIRDVQAHHHVRQGSQAHMERLARRLTGNAVALVFSGGSALGLAFIGVYKALLEAGIPVDYVGGTSMGSLVGAAVARELSYDRLVEIAAYGGQLGAFDLTLPLAALTSSDHLTRICQMAGEDAQIEDLWVPYFCMATSLSRAEPAILERGPLWRAVRASASIPGVFLPMVEEGNVLVDGFLMNNFPVDVMAERCRTSRIIGGLVMPYREMTRQYDYDASLSGWRILGNRINPFSRRLRTPTMLKTLLRAFDVNGLRLAKSQQDMADLLIVPDLKGFTSSDFDKWRPLSQAGYDAAIEPLRRWKAEMGI